MAGPHARVLILGGGDGLAAREVLRYAGVRRVDIVELDAGLVRLARRDPGLSALNSHAYDDPRVHVVTADAFHWLRGAPSAAYDVVIADLPDPGITASAKLYSQEFYGLTRRALAPGGRLAVHAGPVSARPRAFWTVDSTLRAAGLATRAYRVLGLPSGADRAPRDWGFLLAAAGPYAPPLRLDPHGPRLHTLTGAALTADARAAALTRITGMPASTLVHPRY
jgi:spermidine synthase